MLKKMKTLNSEITYLVYYFDIMMLRIFNKWEMNKNTSLDKLVIPGTIVAQC